MTDDDKGKGPIEPENPYKYLLNLLNDHTPRRERDDPFRYKTDKIVLYGGEGLLIKPQKLSLERMIKKGDSLGDTEQTFNMYRLGAQLQRPQDTYGEREVDLAVDGWAFAANLKSGQVTSALRANHDVHIDNTAYIIERLPVFKLSDVRGRSWMTNYGLSNDLISEVVTPTVAVYVRGDGIESRIAKFAPLLLNEAREYLARNSTEREAYLTAVAAQLRGEEADKTVLGYKDFKADVESSDTQTKAILAYLADKAAGIGNHYAAETIANAAGVMVPFATSVYNLISYSMPKLTDAGGRGKVLKKN